MLDKRKFYINGKWVDPIEKNDLEVINHCNEDPFAIISFVIPAMLSIQMAFVTTKSVTFDYLKYMKLLYFGSKLSSFGSKLSSFRSKLSLLGPKFQALGPNFLFWGPSFQALGQRLIFCFQIFFSTGF